jgi:predicted HTH transcriptional regulator
MDGRVDETSHVIFLGKFVNNKKYKEQILQEIIAAICAMLNSNGGIVVVHINPDTIIPVGFSSPQMSLVIRILEQSLISIIGSHQTVSKMNFKEDENSIVIFIKKADSLIITNYNLCLPSKTQVVQTSSLESLEKIKDDIMNRKDILEPVQLGSHCKTFVEDKNCDFHECKISMLKNLKASSSKRTKLADRMTGKGNKFSCYVSAFANYNGGHMYYGIRDDGIVEGEWIPNEDISEIIKKVEKAVNKMIWPQHIGQPKRGEHWDIFFEPVLDEKAEPVPSTYVIVIYIAPCLGGVFTEEPECYVMVEEKVQKMSFATWRKRISQPTELFYADKPKRITWISTKTRNICVAADQLLTQSVNDGESIEDISQYLERSFPHMIEVTLVVLSKKVMAAYRSSFFIKAKKLLHDYSDLLEQTSEFAIFEAIYVYLKTALYRAQGDIQSLRDILASALDKAENVVPGLISAAIYLLVATVMHLFQSEGCSPDLFSTLALEHLQYVQDSPIVRADMEQKSHITSALFYLGSNMSGELTREEIDIKSLEKAKSSVKAVHKSIDEGNPMNNYREIQFNVVRSVLCYRQSQVQSDGKIPFLQEAFNFSKRAEYLSSEYNFTEMLYWARACMAIYTAELVRTHFKPNANTPHYFACNQEPGTAKRLYCNFTLRYNLYLPTCDQQIIEISPKDPVEKVRDILCRNILSPEAVKPGSHVKEFTLGTAVDFRESKTVQFKQLFAKRTNNTSLVQRLIKQGKLPSYVSAFANHSGGYIYIGVRDDGIVQGEKITPQDQTELKKEISKAIGNMIWPDNSDTQDGEEKRWQINFEEVKNTNGEIVPSTFVIVTYVAQCPGGVFTKQPESYEIKENEVKMIDFPTWKKFIVEGLERDKGN